MIGYVIVGGVGLIVGAALACVVLYVGTLHALSRGSNL